MLIAGGDGAVAKCARQMPDRRVPLGIVPLGGANNVATSLGFAGRGMAGSDVPMGATTREFHVGRVTGPWGERTFVEGVGLGALAATLRPTSPPPDTVREKLLDGRVEFAKALAGLEAAEFDVEM